MPFQNDSGANGRVFAGSNPMYRVLMLLWPTFLAVGNVPAARVGGPASRSVESSERVLELPADTIADKIRGGLVGQLLGNLNGLPHENRYYEEPGSVERYKPELADGAHTDDDTDIEWVYVLAMQQDGVSMLPANRITQLWKKHINNHIWCSNLYVRQLMDIGIDPPLTGNLALNPWANFNISGQFVCETFGLIAPAMPQTAARIGLHYTRVSIDGEPAQATQLFTSMIATAFTTVDIETILDAGIASIDGRSELVRIVGDVRRWHKQHATDWRATRRLVRDRYTLYESRTRNQNGYELCTAATVAALLYGESDLVKTLTHVFNFGWDADNNAATAGTIVGVMKGFRWMQEQGWKIKDVYRNTTRPGLPEDEAITSFAERIIEVADRVIVEGGGRKAMRDGATTYRIRVQEPANVESLSTVESAVAGLRVEMGSQIEAALAHSESVQGLARAVYLAVCLDLSGTLRERYPRKWAEGVAALQSYPQMLEVLFNKSPGPVGDRLRAAAVAAGVSKTVR